MTPLRVLLRLETLLYEPAGTEMQQTVFWPLTSGCSHFAFPSFWSSLPNLLNQTVHLQFSASKASPWGNLT